MNEREKALWLWLESLSHRQEDRLCCVCGALLAGGDFCRCWRCAGKGLPAEAKPVWVAVMFCCPTCGQPAELGAEYCVCCEQPILWVLPVRSLIERAGLDGGAVGRFIAELQGAALRQVAPPALPVAFVTDADLPLSD